MRRPLFGTHGSKDDDYESSGNEFIRMVKIYDAPCSIGWNVFWTIVAGTVPCAMNILMGTMSTSLMGPDFKEKIGGIILKLMYCVLGQLAATFISGMVKVFTIPDTIWWMRKALYESLMNLDISYFDKTPTGVLISRLSEDTTLVRQTYFDKSLQILENAVKGVVGLIVALIYSWRVTLSVIAAVPLSGIVFIIGEHQIDKLWELFSAKNTEAADKAEEIITSFRIVKSFDKEEYEADRYAESLNNVLEIYKTTSIVDGWKNGIISFLIQGIQAPIFYFSIWILFYRPQWGMESGDMMVVMMSIMNLTMSTTVILATLGDFKKAQASASKLLQIADAKPKVDRKQGRSLQEVHGKMEFRDVGFKYDGREEYAVRHLSFTVNPGETVAFVGESGCGKSTTLQLIQRFYDCQEGTIFIDDVDIKTLSGVFVRSQISIVPQGPVLFSMSIADNIKYSKPSATDAQVADAARIGNAHNFIMELPDNYKTIVQQTSLSGGQKQRICISRSIIQAVPILLLDEATAALDTESEQLVQQSLETYRHGKTAIMVAHRLATVKNADKIFVYKDGHIEEEGSFQELLDKGGLFSDLVKYQLQ